MLRVYKLVRGDTARCSDTATAKVATRACELGQRSPVNFHSVIERPERVRRVRPPIPIMTSTAAALPNSQPPTALRACAGSAAPRPACACTSPTRSCVMNLRLVPRRQKQSCGEGNPKATNATSQPRVRNK